MCQSESQFPVDFDLAWKWLGYSRKNNAKRALLSCGFKEGIDLLIKEQSTGREFGELEQYLTLMTECFKTWAMMANTAKGRDTDYIEYQQLILNKYQARLKN